MTTPSITFKTGVINYEDAGTPGGKGYTKLQSERDNSSRALLGTIENEMNDKQNSSLEHD